MLYPLSYEGDAAQAAARGYPTRRVLERPDPARPDEQLSGNLGRAGGQITRWSQPQPPGVGQDGGMTTPARVSMVTLGVSDVERATGFYRSLGWSLSSASVADEVSFFHTAGAILALYGENDLADEANQTLSPVPRFRGVALALNCDRAQDVDEVVQSVILAGGTVVSPPRATDWGGYSGYFADPDGHVWEVAYNPSFPLLDDGRLQLP